MVNLNVTAILLAGGPFFFTDFNGNRLDLANVVSTDLNPIISFPPDTPGIDTNQKWFLTPQGIGELQIQSQLGPFLSYPLASTNGNIQFAAAVSSFEFPITFFISEASPNSFIFTDAISGSVLTALSPSVPGFLGTPVTFTTIEGGAAPAQIWTLEQTD